ncbi:hypothetical protein Tco_0174688 [Tanacetum coccineum]
MDDKPMRAVDRVVALTPSLSKTSLKKTVAFVDEGSSNSDIDKIMARMDAMTIKMDAHYKEIQSRAECNHYGDTVIRVKHKQLNLGVGSKRMIFSIDSAMKHSYSNDDTCFSIDVINEILEDDLDTLLDEGSSILYSIEGTPLEDKLFAEFMAMTINENSESEPNEEEITFKKSYSILNIKLEIS